MNFEKFNWQHYLTGNSTILIIQALDEKSNNIQNKSKRYYTDGHCILYITFSTSISFCNICDNIFVKGQMIFHHIKLNGMNITGFE